MSTTVCKVGVRISDVFCELWWNDGENAQRVDLKQ